MGGRAPLSTAGPSTKTPLCPGSTVSVRSSLDIFTLGEGSGQLASRNFCRNLSACSLAGEWLPLAVINGAVYLDIHEPIIAYVDQITWLGVKKFVAGILYEMPLAGFVVILGFIVGLTLDAVLRLIFNPIRAILKRS